MKSQIQKLRAKDETKNKNIKKNKKDKQTQQTRSWYVTEKKQKSVFTEAVVWVNHLLAMIRALGYYNRSPCIVL